MLRRIHSALARLHQRFRLAGFPVILLCWPVFWCVRAVFVVGYAVNGYRLHRLRQGLGA